ncbi:hypothetical protein JAAARDRAFT_57002 [Jaapia argillacea MUCL 33604]|uniref:Aldehyde dehydrogenase domain-containing protein n=1 Tax=Jaapia argillacea MUCL 33604 TaxID=933084 RepID=A0A067PW26_9AGAM|nr:hypothetical protein JAAARDRAFT_57002 [Jaapia argillacea MUCL 33604]
MTTDAPFKAVSFDSDFTHIINGRKVSSQSTREVINPANKTVIATVPVATREQLDQAIDAAEKAFPAWAATPVAERQAAVQKLGKLLGQFKSEFAALLTKEQGKPINTHSGWELGGSEAWFYGISLQSLPDEVVADTDERTIVTRHMPLGVCAGIVPWNFPVLLMVWKIAPALVAGNTMVVKPSPYTPLCNLKFVELAQQVLPPGVLSVLSGDDNLGPWVTSHPKIAKIAFTGSTATGKLVMQSASKGIKRVTLELGGNDPAIVLPDVDPKAVAPELFWAMFNNAGQLCAAAKRIYIHEDIYDAVRDELVKFGKTIKVGDGSDPNTDLGPIQNKMQYEKVKGFFADCKAQGLKFALGGEIDESAPGYFVPPTLVDNPPEDSRIVVEEPFGPIVPLLKWKDEADVIRRANNTDYGLSATLWAKDTEKAEKIGHQLDVGSVWINDFVNLHPEAPFGGHKMSGLGVENSKFGLAAYTNTQVSYRNKKDKY